MILNHQTCCIRLFYNLFYNKMVSIATKEWIIGSSLGWQNSSLQVAFATYNLTLLSTVEGPKTCSVSLPIETSLFQVPTSFETSCVTDESSFVTQSAASYSAIFHRGWFSAWSLVGNTWLNTILHPFWTSFLTVYSICRKNIFIYTNLHKEKPTSP